MDWSAVRDFYIRTRSIKAAAEKFGAPLNTVKTRARRESWAKLEGSSGDRVESSGASAGVHFEPSEGSDGHAQGSARVQVAPLQGSSTDGQGSSRVHVAPLQGSSTDGQGSSRVQAEPPESIPGFKIEPPLNPEAARAAAAGEPSEFHIPASINEWDRLAAAKFYLQQLHWAVHHLFPPDKGEEKERGKRPWTKGWREHRSADVTIEGLEDVFRPRLNNNLGVIMRPPFVAVDLDSKPDHGASVLAWLSLHPQLAHVPCERTSGGVHLHFLCRSLPLHILKARKPPTVPLTPLVTAELYSNGFNLVVSPSIHKSGHRYTWEVTGSIPEVSWEQLCHWFGFERPVQGDRHPVGRPKKEKDWWLAFKGDLCTLDILALFRNAGMLGECLSPDEAKWTVRCPWEHEHSADPRREAGSDTVVFAGHPPAFKCLHAHCAERSLQAVCTWFENRESGSVDALCRKRRGNFAADTLSKDVLVSAWGADGTGASAALVEQHGDPFAYSNKGPDGEREVSDFNYLYWTAQFAFEVLVIFDPITAQFYTYLADKGLWTWQTDVAVRGMIARYVLGYSRKLNQPVLETHRSPDRLNGMVSALKAIAERRDPWPRKAPVIHLANGMLHLDTRPPQLCSFSPHYYSLHQCPIPFDQDARCPMFLRDLIYSSMSHEDACLLQLMGGMFLTGRNSWQKLLILSGTGGAGKGTIVRVLTHIIGRQNVKQLRTLHLEERFELDNLDEATLLVGSDVEGDFLSCRGAKVIKSLTGGDPITMERKGGRKKEGIGDHNIVITCNDKLRVRLDGDESAWKRRLLVIEFTHKSSRVIDDFEDRLMEEEAGGILNWFILGAARLREASRDGAGFPTTPAQLERVETLLAESDSLRRFISADIEVAADGSLTTEEILSAYENFCSRENWAVLSRKRFDQQLGPLMMEIRSAGKRHDIKRGHSTKRGFCGVRLVEHATHTPPSHELC